MNKENNKNTNWLKYGIIFWVILAVAMGLGKMYGVSGGVQNTPPVLIALATFLYILFPFIYARSSGSLKNIGLTLVNFKSAMICTVLAAIIYSVIRGYLIVNMPGSGELVAATAPQTAGVLKQNLATLPSVAVFAFFGSFAVEIFYRGFIFIKLKEYMRWTSALLVSALMFAIVHFFAAGLSGFIMAITVSIVGGWLMQKYNTVLAPIMFHFLQYIAAIAVYYFWAL